ncbi:hypothetical protein ID866_2766 [Astraeus odoratus]|nr:hypothetical protein ID866_2766 [Astraeus odoratus]
MRGMLSRLSLLLSPRPAPSGRRATLLSSKKLEIIVFCCPLICSFKMCSTESSSSETHCMTSQTSLHLGSK